MRSGRKMTEKEMSRITERIVEYIGGNKDASFRAFARDLRAYLDSDLDEESFFQRHYVFVRGKKGAPSEEELAAYESWLATEMDPHGVGGAAHRLKRMGAAGKIKEMRKWLHSGNYKRRTMEKVTKELRDRLVVLNSKINMPPEAEP